MAAERERSTLTVEDFPADLRARLKAGAALNGQPMNRVIIALVQGWCDEQNVPSLTDRVGE